MITARGDEQRRLHERAAAIRDRVFQRSVVVRGVVEVTNICRVNCDYCPMRRDNTRRNTLYTLDGEQLLSAADQQQLEKHTLKSNRRSAYDYESFNKATAKNLSDRGRDREGA